MKKHSLRLALVGAFVALLGALAAPAFGQSQSQLVVDDDGQQCSQAQFESIQEAVDAADPGTQIVVCAGTYDEQVTIGPGKDDIELGGLGSRDNVVIQAPETMEEPGDIVTVDEATNVTIGNFTISGPLPDSLFCSLELRSGVRIKGGGSASIVGNHITEIRSESESLRGCQNGFAVAVGRQFEEETGTAAITNNLIDAFQKGGLYADGPGTQATMSNNEISGDGPNESIAQNGIQVSRDAVGKVSRNRVFDNVYTGPAGPGQASGIILFQSGSGLTVTGNTVERNDNNIGLFDTDDIRVNSNNANDAAFYDGLYADSDSTGNRFQLNRASGNEEHDCHDDSTGSGTAGTANTWSFNQGQTDTPDGICRGGQTGSAQTEGTNGSAERTDDTQRQRSVETASPYKR